MTIASMGDFAESIAIERPALGCLCPVFNNDESEVLDMRRAIARTDPMACGLCFTRSLFAQAVESITLNVSPLLFGAVWKVGNIKRPQI
ncbi:MAG: hypothetical protein H7240_08990 [Glaciimonas sp.]|nr:hypothetical protein [Glaciimonas sp.]